MLLLLACRTATVELPPGDPARPDVILVSIDSLRADHLGTYGNPRDVSPFMDGLAAEGLVYENALSSSPWTLPSHTTMLSGRGPLEHNVVEDDRRIPTDLPLVQEAIAAAGYATAGFVSTTYVSATFGFDRGFQRFEDYDIGLKENLRRTVNAAKVVDDALEWMKGNEGKPAFIFIHLYDVHYPYAAPDPWSKRYDPPGDQKSLKYKTYAFYQKHPLPKKRLTHLMAQYDECIRYVDDQLARLHAALAGSGRQQRWVITADHGEEFGERGSWGHAHTLYPEAMHVPLIVSGAGKGRRSARAGTLDVATTVASLAGVDFPSSGVDLTGSVPPARDWLMETSRFHTVKLGFVQGQTRVEVTPEGAVAWDWSQDPKEMGPSTSATAEQQAAAWSAVGAHWSAESAVSTSEGLIWSGGALVAQAEAGASFALFPPDAPLTGSARRDVPLPPTQSLTDEVKKQLEALGYQQ